MQNVSCVSVTRTPSAAHVSVEVSPAFRRVSVESDCIDEADPCTLIVTLIFSDRSERITKKVELDDCFSAENMSNALIDVHTLLTPVLENEIGVGDALWHLFSVMIAGSAALQVKLSDEGTDLIFSFSYETYESEAVVPLQECDDLFVSVEKDCDEGDDY